MQSALDFIVSATPLGSSEVFPSQSCTLYLGFESLWFVSSGVLERTLQYLQSGEHSVQGKRDDRHQGLLFVQDY